MEHFTISEFIHSDTAIAKKIWNGANREHENNIIALVAAVLDPLRKRYGYPIQVTSGFRCAAVNKNVGGATTSQHMLGEAADIIGLGGRKRENFKLGKMIVEADNFDQVIFENVGDNDLLPEWIHVSWRRTGENRHKILRKVKGKTSYEEISYERLGIVNKK